MASFDEVIPPGKAGSIRASIHTVNLKGSIGKSITVTHDDASQGPINLSVTAVIVGSVEVLPYPALQLARRRRGIATPAKLLVRKDDSEKGSMAISGIAATAPWIKVEARKVTADEPPADGIPAARPGDVVLSVQADAAPVGTHIENVTFKTGLAREPQITIPVTVHVQPIVTVQPTDLILSSTPGQPGAASGQVLVSVRDDLDPKTVAVTASVSAFAVRVDPPGERAFRLFVDWTDDGKHPPTDALIHIRVGTETVDLPVRVNLAKTAEAS